jgi:hypothetical protein
MRASSESEGLAMTRVPWSRYTGDDVEAVVAMFVCRDFPDAFRVRPSRGDGGIDICVPREPGHVEIYQVKKFTENLNAGQKAQIVDSHKRIHEYAQAQSWVIDRWHLVLPLDPTRENLVWFGGVAAAADFPCTWHGLTDVDAWAAVYPGIVDYYLRDGRERLAEELARFSVVAAIPLGGHRLANPDEFSGLEPAAVLGYLGALRDTLNTRDPHFRYDISISDEPMEPAPGAGGFPLLVASSFRQVGESCVTFHVLARCAESLNVRPITLHGNITAVDSAELRELEEFKKFGRVPSVPLGIKELEVVLPGGLGGNFSEGQLVIAKSRDSNSFERSLAVLAPTGETLAQVKLTMGELSLNHDNTGAYNRGTDPTGFLTVETFATVANDAPDMRVRVHPSDPSGYYPDEIEQPLALLHHFGAPNRMRIVALRGTATAEHSLPPVSPESDGFRWNWLVLRYVRALMTIQKYVASELRVPNLTTEDIRDMENVLRAARLLDGEQVAVFWDNIRFTLDSDVELPDGLQELTFQQDLEVSIGDLSFNLGTLMVTAGPAEVRRTYGGERGLVVVEMVPALGRKTASLRWMGTSPSG